MNGFCEQTVVTTISTKKLAILSGFRLTGLRRRIETRSTCRRAGNGDFGRENRSGAKHAAGYKNDAWPNGMEVIIYPTHDEWAEKSTCLGNGRD